MLGLRDQTNLEHDILTYYVVFSSFVTNKWKVPPIQTCMKHGGSCFICRIISSEYEFRTYEFYERCKIMQMDHRFLSFPVVPPRNVRPASMVKEALAVNFLNKSVEVATAESLEGKQSVCLWLFSLGSYYVLDTEKSVCTTKLRTCF